MESKVNEGSTFTVRLPKAPTITIVKSQAAKTDIPESAIYQPLLGQSFLVVDQDTSTRDSIAQLIQAWGGMVDQVSQAVDAVEAVTQKAYDAVMVDNADWADKVT